MGSSYVGGCGFVKDNNNFCKQFLKQISDYELHEVITTNLIYELTYSLDFNHITLSYAVK